ncbi:MAG: hypothetical protein K6G43_08770 [Lachnospiraceae bacterium]|nr:hypothetical protein [Lachnospiraceae bacterium]
MNALRRIFRTENVILGIITIVLIIGAFYLFSITVKSTSDKDNRMWNDHYAPIEADYVRSVRDYLQDNGYVNPGVTLNYVTDENLMRTYTLSIHHTRIENADEMRKEEIEEALRNMGFEDDRCTICIELI